MIELSVILISWNSEKYIRPCIESILESCRDLSYEIIFVDNGSTDQTKNILHEYLKPENNITFIPLSKNRGVAKARNIGIKQSKGEFIWVLDIDTVTNKMAVISMLDYIRTNPECGICACRLENSMGEIQDSCRKYPSLRYKIYNVLSIVLSRSRYFQTLKRKIDQLNQSQFYRENFKQEIPFKVEYVIGACQMIRREVVENVGFLDEQIFYGPEDADFCLRTNKAGWLVIYLPFPFFIHEYQQITNKKLISTISLKHIYAVFYFLIKHRRF